MSNIPYSVSGQRVVDICAVTGKNVVTGDPIIRISGTPLFYRVKTTAWKTLTPGKRGEIETAILQQAAAAGIIQMPPALEVLPQAEESTPRKRKSGSDDTSGDSGPSQG